VRKGSRTSLIDSHSTARSDRELDARTHGHRELSEGHRAPTLNVRRGGFSSPSHQRSFSRLPYTPLHPYLGYLHADRVLCRVTRQRVTVGGWRLTWPVGWSGCRCPRRAAPACTACTTCTTRSRRRCISRSAVMTGPSTSLLTTAFPSRDR
jgi:hypothetical protein